LIIKFIKNINHKFNVFLCKIFSHRISDVDLAIIKIKLTALNNPEIKFPKCTRCGIELDIKLTKGDFIEDE